MWYFNKDSGNFAVGSIPTVEVDGEIVEEQGWELIPTRPEPHDSYVFDGLEWVERVVELIIPQQITPRQCRLQLLSLGLLDEVETMCKANRDMQIWFEYSLDFQRNHPMIVAMASQLGMSEDDMDNFFIEANKL